jgi:hypothetical protein
MKRLLGLMVAAALLLYAAPSSASQPRPLSRNGSTIEIINSSDAGAWITLIVYPSVLGSAHKKNLAAYCVDAGKENIWQHSAEVAQVRFEATPKGCRGHVMLDQIYNTRLLGSGANHGDTSHSRGLFAKLWGHGGRYQVQIIQ